MSEMQFDGLKELGTVIKDPYYDLHTDDPGDSDKWLDLLMMAHDEDFELFSILNYLRGTGVRLVKSPKHNYRIEPIIGEDAWISLNQYNEEKQYLVPYAEKLGKLLKKLK